MEELKGTLVPCGKIKIEEPFFKLIFANFTIFFKASIVFSLIIGIALPFKKYNPICFTIEHNFTNLEKYLDDLMNKNNYSRIFREITAFDGWYVRNDVLNKLEKDTSID